MESGKQSKLYYKSNIYRFIDQYNLALVYIYIHTHIYTRMGRKKKRGRQQDIWCYFCDKTFKDEDLLLSHQLKTHFRCTVIYNRTPYSTVR